MGRSGGEDVRGEDVREEGIREEGTRKERIRKERIYEERIREEGVCGKAAPPPVSGGVATGRILRRDCPS